MKDILLKTVMNQIKPYLVKIGATLEDMRKDYDAKNLKIVIANRTDSNGNAIKDAKGDYIPYMAYIDNPSINLNEVYKDCPETISKKDAIELTKKALGLNFKYVVEQDENKNQIIVDGKPKLFVKDINGLIEMISGK